MRGWIVAWLAEPVRQPERGLHVVLLGVCSECEVDDDCGMGTCSPPEIELDGTVTPGMCT